MELGLGLGLGYGIRIRIRVRLGCIIRVILDIGLGTYEQLYRY
jgi:hypothetical protein